MAKLVVIPFSMPVLSGCPAALFHICISISLEKLSMICALLNRAPSRAAQTSVACQKPGVLGLQPAFKTEQIVAEIGPVAWFHRLWSFAEEPCDCGNGARLGFAHHCAHFEVFCTSH